MSSSSKASVTSSSTRKERFNWRKNSSILITFLRNYRSEPTCKPQITPAIFRRNLWIKDRDTPGPTWYAYSMKLWIALLLTIITFATVAVAQSTKDKIEIGVQTTSLTLVQRDFFSFEDTQLGIGGRFTFNFNRSIAAEAEINFFPQKQFALTADGSAIQAQFGVKAGKRFEKFGVFGRVRPGFLSVNRVVSFIPGPTINGLAPFTIERRALFTLDVGGTLELYPSRRMVVRFDAGDTMIRHPARFGQIVFPGPTVELLSPVNFNHNFQFTAGLGFRLGD